MDDDNRLAEAARAIVAAIEDEGDFPNFHRETMARHRAEWPTLWAAIASLRAVIEGDELGDWAASEARATEEIRIGQVIPADGAEDMIRQLHELEEARRDGG